MNVVHGVAGRSLACAEVPCTGSLLTANEDCSVEIGEGNRAGPRRCKAGVIRRAQKNRSDLSTHWSVPQTAEELTDPVLKLTFPFRVHGCARQSLWLILTISQSFGQCQHEPGTEQNSRLAGSRLRISSGSLPQRSAGKGRSL